MVAENPKVPGDFTPVSGCVPAWIDINEICKEAKRYVGMYVVANFDVVAINNGRAVYTTTDRDGEFRRNFRRVADAIAQDKAQGKSNGAADQNPTLVYDCEQRQEWLAPRESAVRFLYGQF